MAGAVCLLARWKRKPPGSARAAHCLFVGLEKECDDFLPLTVVFGLEGGAAALAGADAVFRSPGHRPAVVIAGLTSVNLPELLTGGLPWAAYRKVIICPRVTLPVGPKWVESTPPVTPFSLAHSTAL